VTAARAAVVVAVLAAAVFPEIGRYRAERLLWRMHAAADRLGEEPAPAGEVEAWMRRAAADAARALRGDHRPWMIAGEAEFVYRRFAEAAGSMRRAARTGERADLDFEIGRACILSRDFACGERAIDRAAWISPAVLSPLPEAGRAVFEKRTEAWEAQLRAGLLTAPPAAPDFR